MRQRRRRERDKVEAFLLTDRVKQARPFRFQNRCDWEISETSTVEEGAIGARTFTS